MVITHHGGECFKVSFGNTTVAFNPIAKDSKLKEVKFGADIAFVSMNHPDFNGVAQVTYGDREPFVAIDPGEYEVGDVTAHGFGVQTTYDGEERYNTIYYVTLEGISMLFLGALSDAATLDAKILGEIGEVDILFVPIGGGDVLDASAASALAVKLEAKLVIPMHYDLPGQTGQKALDTFLKEEGDEKHKTQEKLTIKKKEIATMTGEIVVLKS